MSGGEALGILRRFHSSRGKALEILRRFHSSRGKALEILRRFHSSRGKALEILRRFHRSRGKALQILRRFRRSRSSSSSSSSFSYSPSPDRADGLDKYVYFRAYNYKGETEWYLFNVSSKYKYKKKRKSMKDKNGKRRQASDRIEPVPERSIVHHHFGDRKVGMGIPLSCLTKSISFGCVRALGSFVYGLGDVEKELHEVYSLDIIGPLYCWTKGPPMLTARMSPHGVVLDGKLYVMGGAGLHRDDSEPWAEVFDPCLQKWDPLPTPPCHLLGYRPISAAASLHASKKIVLSFNDSEVFFMYNVMSKSWEQSDNELVIRNVHCVGRPVVVGDTLYWLTYAGQLYVYDFNQKMRFFCLIKGLEEAGLVKQLTEPNINPSLLHLGDDLFCLLWTGIDPDGPDPDLVRCHCVKFRVSKCSESGNLLNAFVVSCQSYPVDHWICFIDGHVL